MLDAEMMKESAVAVRDRSVTTSNLLTDAATSACGTIAALLAEEKRLGLPSLAKVQVLAEIKALMSIQEARSAQARSRQTLLAFAHRTGVVAFGEECGCIGRDGELPGGEPPMLPAE